MSGRRRGAGSWLARKPPKLVAVALKMASTAWALLKERVPTIAPAAEFPGALAL